MFEKGNKIWKLRHKDGRDRLFSTPEELWDAAQSYFEATDNRKWVKKDWIGKYCKEVEHETQTPYTLAGLCLYLHASRSWWNAFKATSKSDFLEVITRIEEIIYTQKFEGATVGAFNANIIARDLGLVDKKDLSSTDGTMSPKNHDLSKLSEQELIEYARIQRKIERD